jgi:hypothetical protein
MLAQGVVLWPLDDRLTDAEHRESEGAANSICFPCSQACVMLVAGRFTALIPGKIHG